MPLKKIALLTIIVLIPSFVYFIMCPCAHTLTSSKSQQLVVVQQQFQKNNFQQKEHTATPPWHSSLHPFNLQAYDIAFMHSLQPSVQSQFTSRLTLLETTRLNI